MKLGELQFSQPTEIVRDGAFQSLGSLNKRGHKVLSYLGIAKYLDQLLSNPDVACVIASPELAHKVPGVLGLAVTSQPIKVFFEAHNYLARETDSYWKSFSTEIAEDAIIYPTAFVADQNVRIGNRTVIGPNASILERSAQLASRSGCCGFSD